MIELELSRISTKIVDEFAGVGPEATVLIITDAKNFEVGKALTVAARSLGASAVLTIMPPMEAHSNEPPGPVASSLKGADIVFMATYQSFSHTDSIREASDAGTELVVMRGVTVDMMLEGGINTDYEELGRTTSRIRDILHKASSARVTTSIGTDIRVDLSNRPAFTLSGYKTETGLGGVGLPPGEVPIAPVEGSSQGTIVIDYSMDNIGKLEEPIELKVVEGYAVEVSGGSEADKLRRLLEDEDKSARNIAEFAIGTNADSRLIGNLAEDKKKRGTVHFAIGDNVSLGGSVRSGLHLDGVVLKPTVTVDGEKILEDGNLKA